MKKGSIQTKIGVLVLVVILATNVITHSGVIKAAATTDTTILTTSLAIGNSFKANIQNSSGTVECTFSVTEVANGEKKGEVQVGDSRVAAIPTNTVGTIEIPNEVKNTNTNEIYTVTSIGVNAFYDCKGITNTGLGSNGSVTSIGSQAFYGCAGLTSTGLESNSSVSSVGEKAFYDCIGLTGTGLENNNTVTILNKKAFMECDGLETTGLESNKKVTSIEGAFNGCDKLTTTGLESNNTVTDITSAFNGCVNLISTGLKNNITVRKMSAAFYACIKLTSTGLDGNTTLTSIDEGAFYGCENLISTGLEKNSTVKTIGYAAFYGCKGLKSTGLESNVIVNSVNEGAFAGCTGLGNVIFKIKQLPTINDSNLGIFSGSNVKVYYIDGTTNFDVLNTSGAVSIEKITVSSITIDKKPKDIYTATEALDPNGLVLKVTYDKGITENIAYNKYTENLFGFDKNALAAGDTTVKITFLGKEVSLAVTVKEQPGTNTDIPQPPEPTKPAPIEPTDSTNNGTQKAPTTGAVTTSDKKIKTNNKKVQTNDSTGDISGIVLSLLVAGVIGVLLIKRKRDIKE